MNKFHGLSMLAALLGWCAACAAPPYVAYSIEDDAEAISPVVVADGELQDVVRAGKPLIERLPEGWLRVVVPIRNIDSEPIEVLGQFSFLDRDRAPLADDTNRALKLIPAGHTTNFEAISRRREAADWTLRLGWSK